MSQKLVVPFMLFDCLVVLLSVFPGKMASEVRIPSAHFIAIIGISLREPCPGWCHKLPCEFVRRWIAIRNAVLTCICCRVSAWFSQSLWWLEI